MINFKDETIEKIEDRVIDEYLLMPTATYTSNYCKLYYSTKGEFEGVYGERKWYMFHLLLVLEVGSKAFAEELISILKIYKIKGQLAVVWPN